MEKCTQISKALKNIYVQIEKIDAQSLKSVYDGFMQ